MDSSQHPQQKYWTGDTPLEGEEHREESFALKEAFALKDGRDVIDRCQQIRYDSPLGEYAVVVDIAMATATAAASAWAAGIARAVESWGCFCLAPGGPRSTGSNHIIASGWVLSESHDFLVRSGVVRRHYGRN
ncbi:hypothetical protein MMC07_001998 [Pseudocyphellaria aurata]|nr:hypothetical protein [Pseudocyphellaria aurata]